MLINGQTFKVKYLEDQLIDAIETSNKEDEQTLEINFEDTEEEKKQSKEGSCEKLHDDPSN